MRSAEFVGSNTFGRADTADSAPEPGPEKKIANGVWLATGNSWSELDPVGDGEVGIDAAPWLPPRTFAIRFSATAWNAVVSGNFTMGAGKFCAFTAPTAGFSVLACDAKAVWKAASAIATFEVLAGSICGLGVETGASAATGAGAKVAFAAIVGASITDAAAGLAGSISSA